MGIFDSIEKLITEHGSASIIRDRLALAADEYKALEKQLAIANARVEMLERRVSELTTLNESLRIEQHQARPQSDHVCDHCGSSNLERTGSRPDPNFAEVGIKEAVFRCEECGRESGFTIIPK